MSARPSRSKGSRTVFVTVGTTKFEALIRAVDTREFADAVVEQGYTNLRIQKGAGQYLPTTLVPSGATSAQLPSGLHIEYFDFLPSLADAIAAAALVISHAGSGSIFETLCAGKPLLVVPNPLLMDNHQQELGQHLAAMRVLACATPTQLAAAVRKLDPAQIQPYQQGDASGIVQQIDKLMGARHHAIPPT